MNLESLLVMAHPAREQTQPDDSVADDHDCGEHRIARETSLFGRRRDHHRNDQRHLDDRHCDREHQCAEWFAGAVRHHLGMVDRGKDRGDQRGARSRIHDAAVDEERKSQDDGGGERPAPSPPRCLRLRHVSLPSPIAGKA
jgi:hypothetical protein